MEGEEGVRWQVFSNNFLSQPRISKISNLCMFAVCGKFECFAIDRKYFCDIGLRSSHIDIEANIINC